METKKFKILLDYISEDSIRYACWSKDKNISEKPDLILKNGVLKYDGTGGNHSYFFKNYNYTYQCVINVLVPDEWPDAYLEIYNEEIRDLLSKNPKNKLDLHEKTDSGVYVRDLSFFAVKSTEEINDVLRIGMKNRSVGATNMNAVSSRSHSLF
jgi:hypothetical protein